MKKITKIILGLSICLLVNAPLTFAGSAQPVDSKTQSIVLIHRLDEIQKMDKSKLTSVEKKTLGNEVKSIHKSLKTMDGGIYISVGAIIIILLLLIILL